MTMNNSPFGFALLVSSSKEAGASAPVVVESSEPKASERDLLIAKISELELARVTAEHNAHVERILFRQRLMLAAICALIFFFLMGSPRDQFYSWSKDQFNRVLAPYGTSVEKLEREYWCSQLPRSVCSSSATASVQVAVAAETSPEIVVRKIYVNAAPKLFGDLTRQSGIEGLQFQYWGSQIFKDERDSSFYIVQNKANMSFVNRDGVQGGVTGRWYRVTNVTYTEDGYVQTLKFESLGRW